MIFSLNEGAFLSKTPFLTFVYLSICNTKLPGILGNQKKDIFMCWSSIHTHTEIKQTRVSKYLSIYNQWKYRAFLKKNAS